MLTARLRKSRRSLLWALAAALLLPLAAMAHDHGEADDHLHDELVEEACLICQIGTGKGGALPATSLDLVVSRLSMTPATCVPAQEPTLEPCFSSFLIRGPPV